MENLAEILGRTKLFSGLPTELIRESILPRGTVEEYPKGAFIISAQQRVDRIMILLKGKVNITYLYADGSYSLASTEIPPRVMALDLIAARSHISPYYAVAAEPSAVFSFPAGVIMQPGCIPEPERLGLLNGLLIMLSHMNMQKEKHLMILARKGLRDRIIIFLSMRAQWEKSSSFTIPFSRDEMAAYLCVNRSALSHELALMKREGIIDFSKNRFTLLSHDYINALP